MSCHSRYTVWSNACMAITVWQHYSMTTSGVFKGGYWAMPTPKIFWRLNVVLWNLQQKAHSTTHLTLGMLLHYLGMQIFSRYGKCKQIAFSVHRFQFLCTRNCVCWVYLCVCIKILSSSLNTMLTVDKHCSDVCCDEFPMPQTDRKSKQVKEYIQCHRKFYLQSVAYGKICYLRHLKYQNLWMNNKVRRDKMEFVCIFISAEYLQKIWLFNFPM